MILDIVLKDVFPLWTIILTIGKNKDLKHFSCITIKIPDKVNHVGSRNISATSPLLYVQVNAIDPIVIFPLCNL